MNVSGKRTPSFFRPCISNAVDRFVDLLPDMDGPGGPHHGATNSFKTTLCDFVVDCHRCLPAMLNALQGSGLQSVEYVSS